MTLNFKKGYLTPNKEIEISEEEFELNFVSSLPNEAHRTELFENYKAFIQAFSKEITPSFEVWIGGSFTTKKEFPKDIDLVIFADYDVFQKKEKEFDVLKMNHKGGNKRLDIYKVLVYPENHRDVFLYESKKVEWLNWFSYTRRNKRTNKRTPRGFIKIRYYE
jgi:DNA polymerase/3'-5' exonuclease PolX